MSRPTGYYAEVATVDPATLSTGADGGLYLPNNLAYLRSDQFDTAAAVGSPVCMIFDRWVANTLGSNLVTNGDFPTNTTGWTAVASTLSVNSAQGRVTNTTAAAGRGWQQITTVVGATYKCTFDLVTNADGAAFCVGTTNGGTQLANKVIAAATTGSFVVYFIATTTTSFIQLRTNVATSTKFTDWDNVTCANVAGRNLLQQTSASAPVLRQDAQGNYYLEFSSSQFIAGGFSYTVQMPNYLVACVQREDSGSSTVPICGVTHGTTSYHLLAQTTSARVDAQLRDPSFGNIQATFETNRFPVGKIAPIDSLGVVGFVDVCQNRRLPLGAATSFVSGTQETLCAPVMNTSTAGSAASGQPVNIYGFCFMAQDPGANRPGVRAYMASLAGAD